MCWCTLTRRTMGPNPQQRYDDVQPMSPDYCCVVCALACFVLSHWQESACRQCNHVLQVKHNTAESHGHSSNDEFQPLDNIYALGDCCANVESPLPALAQASCPITASYFNPRHARPGYASCWCPCPSSPCHGCQPMSAASCCDRLQSSRASTWLSS